MCIFSRLPDMICAFEWELYGALEKGSSGGIQGPCRPRIADRLIFLLHLCIALQLPLLIASNLKKDIVVKSLYFTQLCPDT